MARLKSIFRKIPVIVRALLLGLVIQIVGVIPFMLLANLNLEHGRALPWAALIELGILWVMWRYLGGKGWPASTASTRKRYLRARPINPDMWPAMAVTGVLYAFTVGCLAVLSQLWMPMPPEAAEAILALARAPVPTALGTLLMIAISAGIVEEAAFRGYMQVPIEERHGPVIAIVIVALVFALSHSPPGPILPLFVVGAAGWGLLARLTGSILPGVFFHALVDAFFLFWIWSKPDWFEALVAESAAAGSERESLVRIGIVTLLAALATIASFIWLTKVARSLGPGKTPLVASLSADL